MARDPDVLFVNDFQVFMLITFLKAVWRSKKAVEIKFFLTTFLLDDGRIQIRFEQIMTDPDQGGPKPYES